MEDVMDLIIEDLSIEIGRQKKIAYLALADLAKSNQRIIELEKQLSELTKPKEETENDMEING